MSKTARTPCKTKKKTKTKGRASSASSKKTVSDAAELWVALNKQFCDVFSRLLNVDSDGDDLFIKSRRNN